MVESLARQFNQGGPFMWVILSVLAIACAIVLERAIYYFIYCRGNALKLAERIIDAVDEQDTNRAKSIVGKRNAPVYRILRTAVERYTAGLKVNRIMEGIEYTAIRELPRVTKRINYLSLMANIATLLGLLGTITGLQVSFGSLASVDASQKASMLADGISQAMNTTAFGLIVAVPCMLMYTVLHNKQQAIVKEIDEAVGYFMDGIKERCA